MWKYDTVRLPDGLTEDQIKVHLNAMGACGWELVVVYDRIAIFKMRV